MKGFIYRIIVKDKEYIGCTKNPVSRMYRHNAVLRMGHRDAPLYKYARECDISHLECDILEEVDVEDIFELRKIEQEYIDGMECKLNKKRNHDGKTCPNADPEYLLKYMKEWRIEHPKYYQNWNKKNPTYQNDYYHKTHPNSKKNKLKKSAALVKDE